MKNKKSWFSSATNKLFLDKDGHVAVWQMPNLPLWGWLVFKVAAMLTGEGALQDGLTMFSTTLLFTWAYLEITSGTSLFRRLLGSVVIAGVVAGVLKK